LEPWFAKFPLADIKGLDGVATCWLITTCCGTAFFGFLNAKYNTTMKIIIRIITATHRAADGVPPVPPVVLVGAPLSQLTCN